MSETDEMEKIFEKLPWLEEQFEIEQEIGSAGHGRIRIFESPPEDRMGGALGLGQFCH